MIVQNWLPKKEPHEPPDYDEDVVYAVRAVSNGSANEGQQKLFWRWLMYVTKASEEFQDMSYRPGETGVRAMDFAEGKRFVGMQVRKMLHPVLTPKPKKPATPRQSLRDLRAKREERQQTKDQS
jgi:hypothetical protein